MANDSFYPSTDGLVKNGNGHINHDGGHRLESDLTLNRTKFQSDSISPATAAFNKKLQQVESTSPKWYEVGAANYRKLRAQGLTALPGATLLPTARSLSIPSRDDGRTIPCRVLVPQMSDSPDRRGIFLHIHGGGWVLNDEMSSDIYLQTIADSCGLICVSVGYRLAPEHAYPAAPNDCFDVATWLIANASRAFGQGVELAFLGGESAGANLAMVTALDLLKSPQLLNHHDQCRAKFRLKALLLHYGTYSFQWQPSMRNFRREPTLVLDEKIMDHFRAAYLPDSTQEQLTSPLLSPFFANLRGLDLPPALFTCGTEDCLLDDSVFMCTRWLMAGRTAVLKVYPGSPHGFIVFPPDKHDNARAALRDVKSFVDMIYTG